MGAADVRRSDVFICFSKSRPGEAKVALALKDELEQIGLFAFEYEDWSWVQSSLTEQEVEVDVDRNTLRKMLTVCSIVVLISPHQGAATAGVQTEIAELRSCGAPVILLHWSPQGWHPLLDPPELEGLNIVWSYEGKSVCENDVADNQCEFLARQLAMGSWLACQVKRMRARHPGSVGAILDQIPEEPRDPLLNFQLYRPEKETTEWLDRIDVAELAAVIAADAKDDDLQSFLSDWRDGTDLVAEVLADDAKYSLIHPIQTFRAACESLCTSAERRLNGNAKKVSAHLKSRGLMFARLGQVDEALVVLRQALNAAPKDEQYEIYQALAIAQQQTDLDGAIASLSSAIECAPELEIECALAYNRGVLRLRLRDNEATNAALADFSLTADRSLSATLRHSALRARARVLTDRKKFDAAIADYTRILDEPDGSPRTAVSAWMDRGKLYQLQGRTPDALADWTRAIEAADATLHQKFRTLEARAALLEESKQFSAAAKDLEAMTEFANATRKCRDELKRDAERLRNQS
jgi:tetratricopeptide (TPR) repeat protein